MFREYFLPKKNGFLQKNSSGYRKGKFDNPTEKDWSKFPKTRAQNPKIVKRNRQKFSKKFILSFYCGQLKVSFEHPTEYLLQKSEKF